jgi:hypothetical protein
MGVLVPFPGTFRECALAAGRPALPLASECATTRSRSRFHGPAGSVPFEQLAPVAHGSRGFFICGGSATMYRAAPAPVFADALWEEK